MRFHARQLVAVIVAAAAAGCGGGGGDGGTTGASGCLVSSVTVGPDTLTVTVGETRDIFAAFNGVNCTLANTVTWGNGNASALTLQADGNTAHVTGRAVNAQPIAVTASIGGKSATSQVMVRPPPTIALAPETLTFSAAHNGPSPPSQAVSITNAGGGTLDRMSVGTVAYSAGASGWLLVQSVFFNPTAPSTLNMVPTNTTLPAGTYTATVPIVSPAATNSPKNITVLYTIAGGGGGPSISNLAMTLVSLNSCSSSGVTGNTYKIAFAFSDPAGDAFAGSILEAFAFQPSGASGNLSFTVPSSGVTVSNGTMSLGACVVFGGSTSLNLTISIQSSASGQTSNSLSISAPKPTGGASSGTAAPDMSKLR